MIESSGGVQADFLTKMFKVHDYLDPQPSSGSKPSENGSLVNPSDHQGDVPLSNSRMMVDKKKVQQDIK